MGDAGFEGVLEVFELENKHVYCPHFDEELLYGLVKRGANVWVDEHSNYRVLAKKNFLEFKDNINDMNNLPNFFDYSIALDYKINLQDKTNSMPINQRIILLEGTLRLFKWHLFNKRNYKTNEVSTYSVAPSFKNVKLVIPEISNRPSVERYWSLHSMNPLISLKLFTTWTIIKSHSLRKLFIDKIIVIK